MKHPCLSLFLKGVLLAILSLPAAAQGVPRVKGRIVDFDGLTFHLAPEGGGPQLAVRLQPHTQFMTFEQRALSAFTPGAWAGATVTMQGGALVAEEVHLFPAPLRGSGEGRLPQGTDRFVINGAVTAAGPNATGGGKLTLFYRGGRLDGGICLDRPDPKAASPVCTGDPVIQVPREAAVQALVPAPRTLLTAGAIATVSVETDAKGARSTPGLILEKPQTSK
jgi:hypothetical protein